MELTYRNGVFYNERLAIQDNFALLLEGQIVAFGTVKHLNDGDFDAINVSVRLDGTEKMKTYRSALTKKGGNKHFLSKLYGMTYHENGMPDKNEGVKIPAYAIADIEKAVEKANSFPDLTQNDLIEVNLNLTFAAKIVEKANGPQALVNWLNNVNRKAIALVNKGEEK